MSVLEFLGKAIVPLAVVIAFAFFRKRYPSNPSRLTQSEIERLDSSFRSMKWLPQIFMVLIAIIFLFSTHAALVALNKHFAPVDSPTAIVLLPQTAIWWFFPGIRGTRTILGNHAPDRSPLLEQTNRQSLQRLVGCDPRLLGAGLSV